MRLLFFHAYPHQFAGAQLLTLALARELIRLGHDVLVVVPDDGPFADRLRDEAVPTRIVRAPPQLRLYGRRLESRAKALAALTVLPGYWLRLRGAMRSWRPDVVHVNDHRGALVGAPAARLARLPVVWHLHGPYRSNALTLLGGALARRIVVVSEATRRDQPGLERFASKTKVVHNGLLTESATGSTPTSGMPRDGELVVTGARLHPDKGIDVLLQAAGELRERFPRLRVVVAGAPQPGYELHHAELLELRRELRLEQTVEFCGLLRDPLDLWRQADVYVQPSRREPFGLGVLEAMSVGTPVVATSAGGLAEVVEPEVSGLQVTSEDPAELATAIGRVLSDSRLAARLARSGVERARAFSKERMVAQLLDIYAEAAKGRAA
jgi:glycosyltransferase involved in cell wall biosynthesis